VGRRNDAPWRNECIALYGDWCRRCKRTGVQMDHMIPRSQGGPSVVENGLPLCPACHQRKTEHAHELLIQPEWLTDDQIRWLADNGYAWWDDEGEVYGTSRRIFAKRRTPT